MLTKNINFKNFNLKKKKKKIKNLLKKLLNDKNEIIKFFKKNYKDSYSKKIYFKI